MNYTTTYHLPQWEETDRIMMEDFNQMCANMEKGLKENSSDAAHAERIADAARSTASSAVSMAEQAINKAKAAQKTADNAYSPDQKPYVVGSYVGNGIRLDIVDMDFKPSFIIISGQESGTTDMDVLLATAAVDRINITFHPNGFRLYNPEGEFPHINIKDRTYHYIAFR